MKRVLDSLNDMAFDLPEGWSVTEDKYYLMNGQGFINKENYLSQNGKVISLFEIHRDPEEFFECYQKLVESYDEKKDDVLFEREFSLKFNGFDFPVYILKGTKKPTIYIVQVFVNCGDRLACFMISIDELCENNKDLVVNNETFSQLGKILRTIQ